MRRINYLLAVLAFGAGGACEDDETPNVSPIANAGPDQKKQEVGEDGCEGIPIPDGETRVDVTLDGAGSTDRDGKIVEYLWLNAKLDFDSTAPCPTRRNPLGANVCLEVAEIDVGDAGADAQAAAEQEAFEDALAELPDEIASVRSRQSGFRGARPTLSLSEGRYRFALWVTDDDGAISEFANAITTTDAGVQPAQDDSVVEVIVGCPPEEVDRTCLENVYTGVPDACQECVCTSRGGAQCPQIAPTCNETCWGLINCVATECGGDSTLVTECIIPNCSDFLAAANEAIAMTDCAVACTDQCTPPGSGPPLPPPPDAGAEPDVSPGDGGS